MLKLRSLSVHIRQSNSCFENDIGEFESSDRDSQVAEELPTIGLSIRIPHQRSHSIPNSVRL